MATRTNHRNARPGARSPAFPLPKIHPAGWYDGGDLCGRPGTAIGKDGTVFHDTLIVGQSREHRLALEDPALGIKVVLIRTDTLCLDCLSGHVWATIQVQFSSLEGDAAKEIDDADDAINVTTIDHECLKPFAVVSAFARLLAQAVADAEGRGWLVEPDGPRRCPPQRGGKHARAS